ncbi:MAG: glycosyltransferase family 9 protein [Armatimonadetes bacterium]|nr:glycosyltransferase family 9 protein [Armatimonadota bacterium]
MRTEKPAHIRKILIVKLSSIGDVLMATPVPRALKERLPDSHIAWLVEEKSREVVEGNPYVDEVIVYPLRRWQKLISQGRHFRALREVWAFLAGLRARRFDLAIDIQGLLRSGIVTWLSGAPYRLGRDDGREGNNVFLTHMVKARKDYVRASELNLEVLSALGIKPSSYDLILRIPTEAEEGAERFLADEGLPSDARIAALAPATTRPNKHWTEEGFAEVSDRLYEEYQMRSVLLGGPADAPMMERIASLCRHRPLIAAGKASYKESAALIRRSRILVSVDTGLLRVGIATKTPTIALFGPTNPAALRQEERCTVVLKEFPCQFCRKNPTCGDRDCMRAITSGDVMQAVSEWLHSPAPWLNTEL